MKLVPRLSWQVDRSGGETLDPRLLPLLAGIREHQTLGGGARAAGLSYRAAWNMVADAARAMGGALVVLERGRGASLSEAGQRLVDAHARLERDISGRRIELALGEHSGSSARGLQIVASHDLALADLCDRLSAGIIAGISFRGSLDSLGAFARGEADVAGFHLTQAADVQEPATRWLDGRRDRLVRFAEREQGLIVRRGNPRRLRTLQDIASRAVRFVNRQRGSGTRLLLDRLLSESGISPGAIRGYATEEHTHLAVAATVASGGADAGFGLRAAAARLDMDFVPLAKERYWLAIHARDLREPAMRSFLEALAGPLLKELGKALPGYSMRGAGQVVGVKAGLGQTTNAHAPKAKGA